MEARKRVAHEPDPENALSPEVHRQRREAWLAENREAIEAYNAYIKQHGVFSTGLRGF